jgi:superfamily I DNA and/or RNA helicase
VVCCTLSGAGSQPLLEMVLRMPDFAFDAVVIDEAAQAVGVYDAIEQLTILL